MLWTLWVAWASAAEDLTFVSLTAPNTLIVGQADTCIATVRNIGTALNGSFSVTLRASLDQDYFFLDDEEVAYINDTTGLGAGQSRTFNLPCTLGGALPYTAGWVVGRVFGANPANDANALNNDGVSAPVAFLTAAPGGGGGPPAITSGPDLIVNAIQAPASIARGATFSADVTVRNEGDLASLGSVSALFLSTDLTRDAGDVSLCSATHGSINPARNSTATATGCSIPTGQATGTYYVLVEADALSANNELDEANNAGSVQLVVTGTGGGGTPPTEGPDLKITRLDSPAQATLGDVLGIDITVRNEGTSTAAASSVQLRLSRDGVPDAGDALVCEAEVGAIAAGATASATLSGCALPATFATASAYLVATADAYGDVVETDETDNTLAKALTLLDPGPRPDLVVTPDGDVAETQAGATFELPYVLDNLGDANANAHSTLGLLSTDDARSEDDAVICDDAVNRALEGESQDRLLFGCAVPADWPPGSAFVLIAADGDDDVDEADEGNNVVAVPITVLPADAVGDTADGTDRPTYSDLGGCSCRTTLHPAAWSLPGLVLVPLLRRRRG
jgi:MYXO-CTERM domain-containing protein